MWRYLPTPSAHSQTHCARAQLLLQGGNGCLLTGEPLASEAALCLEAKGQKGWESQVSHTSLPAHRPGGGCPTPAPCSARE